MVAKPHVLISDIAMPGEDGYELIRKIIALELAPKISAIAITAYAKEEDRDRVHKRCDAESCVYDGAFPEDLRSFREF